MMKALGIPAKDLWEVLLRKGVLLYFHEDNQAMIQVVKTGRNPTMRHLGRVHRIAVAWLHERWEAGDCTLFYEKSELMAADIYTKSFTNKDKWTAVCWLINVVDPKALPDAIHYNEEVRVRLEAEAAEKAANNAAVPAPAGKAKAKMADKLQPETGSVGDCARPTNAESSDCAAICWNGPGLSCDSSQTAAPSAEEATAMPEVAPSDDTEWRGVTELCTSNDSALGRKTRFQKGCRVTRITREVDFTKSKGLNMACDSIRGPLDVLWVSLPCVGGCPWQYVNAKKGPEAVRRLQAHWALHGVMWKQLLKVLAIASDKGATICIEWPRACRYWHTARVQKALAKYGLVTYDFDGCMYGIESIAPKTRGLPIKKPWRLATNSQIMGQAFSTRCGGCPKYVQCEGVDTPNSEKYSDKFAEVFHKAWKKQCLALFHSPAPQAATNITK